MAVALQQDSPNFLERVDFLRLDAGRKLNPARKSDLGQFMTPMPVAQLMGSMLEGKSRQIRILDAGAGVGSLFAAAVSELCSRQHKPEQITVTAYEIDERLAEYARDTLLLCKVECERAGIHFSGELIQGDFVENAAAMLNGDLFSPTPLRTFNAAILNPPYKKINTNSEHRRLLRQIGVETSNIYAGFLAATVQLLEPGGELVAITPRSFCNGSYFRPFRDLLLRATALRRLHLFESREEAFRDDDVLQETVILHAIKGGTPDQVVIASSTGPDDTDSSRREVDYDVVVHPGDPDLFIRIVSDNLGQQITDRMESFNATLGDLGLTVSTGRVVDFRALDYLRPEPEPGSVPLIYPANLGWGHVTWPIPNCRKSQAIVNNEDSAYLMVPNETYVLVKRFTSKEERRRVVASVFRGGRLPGDVVGFENHTNYYHQNGRGLELALARGLAAYLNSTLVDEFFRQFNGHTQVNATDLRNLKYPTLQQLAALGSRIGDGFPDQHELDELVEKELLVMSEGVNPVHVKHRIDEALSILKDLGLPRAQQNERSALTLLALLELTPDKSWPQSSDPLMGITPIMEFIAKHYAKTYAPNSRETVRRFTVHQFLQAGLIVENPDRIDRPVNSPKAVYQIEQSALGLLRTFGTPEWDRSLRTYLVSVETLVHRYAREREMTRIPVQVARDKTITLSPGGQNVLVEQIINEFAPRFTPGGKVIYVGDTDEKWAYFDEESMRGLGVEIEAHGKMPDVVIHHTEKNWLVLIEAVTSHGPVNPKRREELKRLFARSKAGLVFVTAFLSRSAMVQYLGDISWETEVWVAEAPSHLIHFNGERFLGPYPD